MNSKTGKKLADNSIYSFMDRVKQNQSPLVVKSCRMGNRSIASPLMKQIPESYNEIKLPPSLELKKTNSISEFNPIRIDYKNNLKKNSEEERKTGVEISPDNNKKGNKKSYQREISINTTNLDTNQYKRPTPSSKGNSNVSTDKVRNKSFNFSNKFFNPRAPYSPNRSILFSDFLKNRIGNEKFNKIISILEEQEDPITFLNEEKARIIEILGEENVECLKIFKYLISSTTTPPNTTFHFRNQSVGSQDLVAEKTSQKEPDHKNLNILPN